MNSLDSAPPPLILPAAEAERHDAVTNSVVTCLRGRRTPDAGPAAAARALAQFGEAEWQQIERLAKDERLEALLLSVLGDSGLLPEPIAKKWRLAHLRNAGRNTLAFRELADVLRQLAEADAPVLVLKGAALARTVYEDPALRPMTDLDLLVHRADVPQALQALHAAGYTIPIPELGEEGALAYTHEFVVHRPGGLELPVELHSALFDSPFYDRKPLEEWLWETAVPTTTMSDGDEALRGAHILGPEAQILHLCGHLALHHTGQGFQGLLWLNDIAEVVTCCGDHIDWQAVVEQAKAFGLVLPLQQALPQVAGEWGAPVPAATLAQLRDTPVSPAEAEVFRWMTDPDGGVALEVWTNLAGMSSLTSRGGYLVKKLFPSRAYMRQRYDIDHPALLPLYYPRRWWLGLRSALVRVVRVVWSRLGQREAS